MVDNEWRFADEADAARYLAEVRRLWLAWLLGLAGLMFAEGWWVIVAGVVTVGLLLALARPLQARAAAIVPEDTLVGGKFNVVGKGTARDRVLKQLAYGRAPLERAAEVAGRGGWLIGARAVMIGLTVLAFVYVVVISLDAPTSA
jgi:hypothetical protein